MKTVILKNGKITTENRDQNIMKLVSFYDFQTLVKDGSDENVEASVRCEIEEEYLKEMIFNQRA